MAHDFVFPGCKNQPVFSGRTVPEIEVVFRRVFANLALQPRETINPDLGMGKNFDQKVTQAMTAGTYGYWEPDMEHFVWIKGETVVQFHGIGPWVIKYVDPKDDPRNQPKSGK